MTSFASYFSQQISDDLDWREIELAVLRRQLHQTIVGSTQERTFLRTNLAMIYAHYEGFCKFAFGVYIDALERSTLTPIDLRWEIAAHGLRKLHSQLGSISDSEKYFSLFFEEFEKHLSKPASYERPEGIANLWPDLLLKWQSRFAIDSSNVQNERTRLENLVNTRNQIAHGKNLTVANRAELDKHSHSATLAMHEVAVGITDALDKRLYARQSKVMTVFSHAVR
jgi:hypothetical protein